MRRGETTSFERVLGFCVSGEGFQSIISFRFVGLVRVVVVVVVVYYEGGRDSSLICCYK